MELDKKVLSDFFEKNRAHLENSYPGLRLKRLEDELSLFSGDRESFFSALLEGYPLEYITNTSFFFRSDFFVDERVLIPRSETEILVEDVINYIHKSDLNSLSLAEVGVGSFALGLSILIDSQKTLDFWGGDISIGALDVASLNLKNLQKKFSCTHRVELFLSDRLKSISQKELDIIVSNPPYIRFNQDRAGVHSQADSFEPHIALYLKDCEFEKWFDQLFKESAACLKNDGAFFMEGHEDSLDLLAECAKKYFVKVELKNDYTNRLRFLYAKGIK